ncbi:DUF6221 family protein [Streptomyces sp. NPDC058807]|uniref:DUF6221 family protein n=1 Tax=unclassified Streptomyces TaxID=2593676 RepID=UPI0036A006BC
MDDLVQWLGCQPEEDERIAEAATPGPWHAREGGVAARGGENWPVAYTGSCLGGVVCEHFAEHDPTRVLDELSAKTKLMAWARKETPATTEKVLRLLSEPYAHRPGYRDEWRP